MIYFAKPKTDNIHALKLILALAFVLAIGSLIGANTGDYRTKWGWGEFSDPGIWDICTDGTNDTWTSANSRPPDGFTGTIYGNHTIKMDIDYTLTGNLEMATGTTLYVGFTDSQPFQYSTMTVNPGVTINYAAIQIHHESILINNGEIIARPDAGNFFIAPGSETSVATLENNGLIQIDNSGAKISFMDYVVFISGEDGRIVGDASCETNNETHFFIANVGGLEEANQLTGTHTCHTNGLNITFNGTKPQKTGTMLPLLRRVVIDNPYGVQLEIDLTIFANDGEVRVTEGSILDVQNHIISTSNQNWGFATFYLEEDATIITQNPDGISSRKTGDYIYSGSIQMNYAVYSSSGNYTYNGTGVQFTGCFDTTPIPNTVKDLTADPSNGLTLLIFCEEGIDITGDATGEEYFDGHDTVPVTLANLLIHQTPMGMPQLTWVTASETNCLGFYVWRAKDTDLDNATKISPLIQAVNTSQGAAYAWTDKEIFESGMYYYWLEDVSFDHQTAFHGPRLITIDLLGNQDTLEVLQSTGLKNAYPNPFNPSVTLSYYLEVAAPMVTIDIYNQKGQRVDTMRFTNQASGTHQITWDAGGLNLASGIYFARFTSGSHDSTLKLVLSK